MSARGNTSNKSYYRLGLLLIASIALFAKKGKKKMVDTLTNL